MLPDTNAPVLPRCFLNESGYIQNLVEHECGGVAVIRSRAGCVRANHYHQTDWHYLYIISGSCHYFERPVGSDAKPRHREVRAGELIFTGPQMEHVLYFPESTLMVSVSKLNRKHETHEQDVVRLTTSLLPEGFGK